MLLIRQTKSRQALPTSSEQMIVHPSFLTVPLLLLISLTRPVNNISSVCSLSDGKRQPLFFQEGGELIYPKERCSLLFSQGELFENVAWVGCSSGRNNKLLGKNDEVLAEDGKLMRININTSASFYRCESVNSASVQRNGNVFEFFFKAKAENGTRFNHTIYWIKWNETMNAPIWARHIPSISFSTNPSMIDTQIRAPWRYSKLVFGYNNDPREAFRFACKQYGMSRGHLAPAGDFLLAAERWATFQLSNVVPQPQTHNNGAWKAIEDDIRANIDRNTIQYVETGPIFDENGRIERIKGVIPIPIGMYKKVIGRDNDKLIYYAQSHF